MRTKFALINSIVGLIGQVFLVLSNLVVRRIFVATIGLDYLGINGLFGNILSFLALTESGVGIAMAYSLYAPVADNNEEKIRDLMLFYKKAYIVIALGVAGIGSLLIPIIPYLVTDTIFSDSQIILYYCLFLLDNVVSYFLAYRTTFLNACQKNYVITTIRTIVMCVGIALKSIALALTHDFVIYLLITIAVTFTNNVLVSFYVDKKYKFLKSKEHNPIPNEEKKNLFKNIKGLFLHKIGAFAVFGTDNIIISLFLNLRTVGIYSNYTLILTQLNTFATQLFNAIIPGVGNYIAVGEKDSYKMYKNILFINFLLYGSFTSILVCVIQPFLQFWIGKEGLLTTGVVFLILLDFYLKGMRNTVQIFKTAGGIFYQDRYSPLVEAVINLVVSIVLTSQIGLPGVFLGTIISGLCAPFLITPYYLFKDLFGVKFKYYLRDMIKYFGVLIIITSISVIVGKIEFMTNLFLDIVYHCIVLGIIDIVIYILLFRKTDEFKYLFEKVKSIIE